MLMGGELSQQVLVGNVIIRELACVYWCNFEAVLLC